MAKKSTSKKRPARRTPAPAGRSIRDVAPRPAPPRAIPPSTPSPSSSSEMARVTPTPSTPSTPMGSDGDGGGRRKLVLGGAAVLGVAAIAWALWPRTANATPRPTNTTPPRPTNTTPPRPTNTTPPANNSNNTTLQAAERGLSAEQISRFKRILLGLGYSGIIADPQGMIGNYTRIALRAFQQAWNTENRDTSRYAQSPGLATRTPRTLTIDGVLGPNTRQALDYYAERANWTYNASGQRVS